MKFKQLIYFKMNSIISQKEIGLQCMHKTYLICIRMAYIFHKIHQTNSVTADQIKCVQMRDK